MEIVQPTQPFAREGATSVNSQPSLYGKRVLQASHQQISTTLGDDECCARDEYEEKEW